TPTGNVGPRKLALAFRGRDRRSMNCGPNRRERTRGFPRSVDELRPFIKDILILVLRVERVRVVHDNAEPRCSHFVFVLKLHVQLDSVAPQADVVPLVSWQAESQRESESIDVEANSLRHISGTKNRLDLTERCGVHKALTIYLPIWRILVSATLKVIADHNPATAPEREEKAARSWPGSDFAACRVGRKGAPRDSRPDCRSQRIAAAAGKNCRRVLKGRRSPGR